MSERTGTSIWSKFGADNVQPTDLSQRTMGLFSTFALWLGANVVVTTVYTGMFFVPDLRFTTAIFIILLGSVIGGIPLTMVATMGTATGLPTMALTRGSFGVRGSVLPSVINIVILIGWAWVQAFMAGLSLNYAVKYATGYDNLALWTIVCEVIVVIVTLYGHRGIEAFERVVATGMLLVALVVFWKLFTVFGVRTLLEMQPSPKSGVTAAIAFDMVVATAISWAPVAADYNRNCKSTRVSWWGTMSGYVLATLVAMGTGAAVSGLSIASQMEQTFDPTVLLARFGFGIPAALVVFASVLTTNLVCVYSSAMSYLNLFPKTAFWKPALIIGIITVAGALYGGIMENFVNWILLIGTLFMPLFAVMLADFHVFARGRYNTEEMLSTTGGRYWYASGVNWVAVVVYLVGAFAAYYWTKVSPLPYGATLPSFLMTFVLYVLAGYAFGLHRHHCSGKEEVR